MLKLCFCVFFSDVRLYLKFICFKAVNLLDVLFLDLEVSERNSSLSIWVLCVCECVYERAHGSA